MARGIVIEDDGEGHVCDATCYNARGMSCSCTCGGKNHGMGLNWAMEHAGMDDIKPYNGEDMVGDDTDYCEDCGTELDSDGLCPQCDYEDEATDE